MVHVHNEWPFLISDLQDGTAATAAADNLHGDGGECNISNSSDKAD